MKNFSIPGLTLLILIVMVYAAPHPTPDPSVLKEMLRKIHHAAENLSKTVNPNERVAKISSGDTTCVKNFFCLAEKNLKNVTDRGTSNLTHHLHQYNKGKKTTVCTLPELNMNISLQKFLKDIKNCAGHPMESKKKIMCII